MSSDSGIVTPAMPEARALTTGATFEGQVSVLFANQRKLAKQMASYAQTAQALGEAIKVVTVFAKRADQIEAAQKEILRRLSELEKSGGKNK